MLQGSHGSVRTGRFKGGWGPAPIVELSRELYSSPPKYIGGLNHSMRFENSGLETPTTKATRLADIFYGVGHLLVLSKVLRQGLPRLLQHRRGADVDFCHHHRDRDLDRKNKTKPKLMARPRLEIGDMRKHGQARYTMLGRYRGVIATELSITRS